MPRFLNRIWIRFGLGIAATVLLTIGILAASVYAFSEWQYRAFERTLPPSVRVELSQLVEADQEDGPRAMEIYGKYWKGDLLFGEKFSLLVGLAVCLPIGLIAGFWVSRAVTLPLDSMAEAAQRIARGDLAVRAEPTRRHGEMAEMVQHFNDMADALEAFERERKATTAAISHELRTPLTVLRARLHAACDGVIEPSPQEFAQLLEQAEHLGRLVDDLHTLSMSDAGRLSLHRMPLDLGALAREMLDEQRQRFEQFGIEATLEVQGGPVVVLADRDRMRQVLLNLLENALRHARSGRWIGLVVRREGPAADDLPPETPGRGVLSVSDAGPGLPETTRERLFQRFVRADSDPDSRPDPKAQRAGGGSGLGLSVVHMLVTRHGGNIEADVSPRGGTRFTLWLPLATPGREGDSGGA